MEWRYELYRAVFVALGMMELISNSIYLIRKDGIQQARKQHKEIPPDVTDTQMRRKVIMMFLFGILFLIAGISSYIIHDINYAFSLGVLIALCIYSVAEALYYRFLNTFGFASVSLIVLILFVI